MAAGTAAVVISHDADRPERYCCEGRGCNYSSSHCEGYGGFVRVAGHMLCPECAGAYTRLQEGFFER